MLYQELKKRIKLRDQKAEQEKNLVVQTKLIRIKDQRVPRCVFFCDLFFVVYFAFLFLVLLVTFIFPLTSSYIADSYFSCLSFSFVLHLKTLQETQLSTLSSPLPNTHTPTPNHFPSLPSLCTYRLQDLTMRPSMSGRKCVGSLEAHQVRVG